MADTRVPALSATLVGLGRSLGTFAGVAWLCVVTGTVLARVSDASVTAVPAEWLGISVLAVAFVVTSWLVDGGFDRLGADPSGGLTFVWLAVFFVPLAFLPTRVTLDAVANSAGVLDAAFILATTLFAGWLAFYGGLERLSLAPDDFLQIAVFVVALGAPPAVVAVLADASWLTIDPVAVALALVVQGGACWLGVRMDVP
ncbi:hypothetical protein [Natronorubrum daqingense]|uniref:Uncharacterized protein n=1 Tax=Natronorubrum daqingense TaxID=588898 RepID=A0A1N7ALK8_9EURY|nr:hypothetical protein [Natronorubrum daqingense]APX97944.1 hypothetical protein BB347_15735 [Natronorubrum daqingense]SIR39886.1 hypothetical protein SAMN05421809_1214 [Natronorubrum daqingense]